MVDSDRWPASRLALCSTLFTVVAVDHVHALIIAVQPSSSPSHRTRSSSQKYFTLSINSDATCSSGMGLMCRKGRIPRRRHARFFARKLRVSDVYGYRLVGRVGVDVGVVECGLNAVNSDTSSLVGTTDQPRSSLAFATNRSCHFMLIFIVAQAGHQ